MTTIAGVLGAAPRSRTIVVREPRAGDLGWVILRHGELYGREYGWDELGSPASWPTSPSSAIRRASAPGSPRSTACPPGACSASAATTERQLRSLLVEPRARGVGIGARLVDECLAFAHAAGYAWIMLWTQDCLEHSRRIYERSGFSLEQQAEHSSFGHDLVEQYWSRSLTDEVAARNRHGRTQARSRRR